MGGSKKQTVGYEYPYDLQFGLCYAADALLEFRGGDATAWAGQVTDNATVAVNAPHLWGGQDNGGEGGIVGEMDVMFGDPDQEPHPYLVEHFDQDSALRGKVTVLFRDTIYGAYNPYPKPPAFKVRRIFSAWPEGEAWYSATAMVEGGWIARRNFAENFTDGLEGYTVTHGPPGQFSVVEDGGAPALRISGGTDGTITKPLGMIGRLRSLSLKFKTVSSSSDDFATIDFRRSDGMYVFGFNQRRQNRGHPTCYMSLGTSESGDVVFTEVDITPGVSYRFTAQYLSEENRYACSIGVEGAPEVLQTVYLSLGQGQLQNASTLVFRREGAGGVGLFSDVRAEFETSGGGQMNAAHILYYSFVSPTMEGLPSSALDDAHWRIAADVLHGEKFGLCTEWVPGAESVDQFRQRICNVIGGFLAKSRRDGKWRLHLPRGQYVLEDLPILTDDDVLEWKEEPSTIDDAVNQLQTRWFDPVLKETRMTPAEHALGAIDAFGGIISQTVDYPEITDEPLALRKNAQELRVRSTPLRRISPVCNRKVALWDVGTYFRVQCPKRGIADMVMLLARNDVGESPTSACQLRAMEDIWTMPATSYTGPQEPVDYNPPQIPLPAPAQRAFEAPYVELAATLPSGTLETMAPESGYLQFVAQQPASGINYTLATAAEGEDFEEYSLGDWCPAAVVTDAVGRGETVIALGAATGLRQVAIGSAVLWDDEICRVDALDLDANPVLLTLGRGCADTVEPVEHAAGSRIWFYDEWATTDQREYALGETVSARALTRTSRDRLRLHDAPVAAVEMRERHARPYPPARVRINGEIDPPQPLLGMVDVTWSHRDRLLQADQLVDQEAGSVGPAPGTTYNVRWYANDELVHAETGLTDPIVSYAPAGGLIRVEIETEQDGLVSWQAQVREFVAGAPLLAEGGTPITAEDDQPILME